EHIIVVEGKALVGLIDEAVELGVGDYICYPADQKHIFRALETGTKALLISEQN
ncbi:cupin domain-containing protein, partial [Acinetobacter sp. A11]